MKIENSIEVLHGSDVITIKMSKFDPYLIEKIKELNGSTYDPDKKVWNTDIENQQDLDTLFTDGLYEYIVLTENTE